MLPADIIIKNDSETDVVLTHVYTEYGDNGSKVSYRGKPSYWKTTPPEVGFKVASGQSANVGTINTVCWWDSPSWIFLEYAGTSSTKLQIFVDMQGPDLEYKGVWAAVGPSDPTSTEDKPMPLDKRQELIVYELDKSPNWSVTIHIPPSPSWKYLTPPVAQSSSETGETIMQVINVALSTLITICFVIPPAAEVGAALQAMSTAGKAAVALTAAQGVLGIFTAPSHPQVPRTFGSEQAYAANKLTQKEWVENKLRLLMDKYQSSFHHNEDGGGIETKFKSVAEQVRVQLEKADSVVIDDDMLGDIKDCLAFFDDITDENKAFQAALLDCLDTGPLTEDIQAPPDKLKLALGFAGLSMALTAYSNTYAIRSFVTASENADKLIADLKLEHINADTIYEYVTGKINFINKPNITKAAKAHRIGLVKYSTDTVDEFEGIASPTQPIPPHTYQRMVVSDAGVESAPWGFVKLDDADNFMSQKCSLEKAGGFVSGKPRQWHAKEHYSDRGARDSRMFDVYTAYSQFLCDKVDLDIAKAVDGSIADFKDAIIPYMADIRKPLPPYNPDMKLNLQSGTARVLNEDFSFTFVQYGFAYANFRNKESSIYWHGPTSLAPADNNFPTGIKLTIPKNPLNLRAEELAKKAKTIQDAAFAQPGATISPLSKTKTLNSLPSYITANRNIYRRFGISAEELKKKPASEGELIKKLGNLDDDVFLDAWNAKTGALIGA